MQGTAEALTGERERETAHRSKLRDIMREEENRRERLRELVLGRRETARGRRETLAESIRRSKEAEADRDLAREQHKEEAEANRSLREILAGKPKAANLSDFEEGFQREHGRLPNLSERVAYEKQLAEARRDPDAGTRGTYMPLTDEAGRVIAAWNPKQKEVVPVPPELAGARKSGLSETAMKERSVLADLSRQTEMLEVLAQKHKGRSIGPIDAPFGWLMSKTFGNKPEVAEMRRLAGNLSDMLLRARSGAQINEAEYVRLARLTPNISDPESNFFAKLTSFKGEVNRQLQRRSGKVPVASTDVGETQEGTTRRNRRTGEVQEFRGGKWVRITPAQK